MTKYEKFCPKCSGIGVVQNQEWKEYFTKMKDLIEKYALEDIKSYDAWDKAKEEIKHLEPTCPEEEECSVCEGKGTIPTKEGSEILEFIKKFNNTTKNKYNILT